MYAIFEDGSRQYRAEQGELVVIDFREGVQEGDTIELTNVLLIESNGTAQIGLPTVAGAKVVAKVVGFPRVKTMTQKFRRRKATKRLRGHTQPHVRIQIESIVG